MSEEIIYRYTEHLGTERPVILLPFSNPENESIVIELNTLVDSGADKSHSFKEIGEVLGIKFPEKASIQMSGLYGTESGWSAPIQTSIGGKKIIIDVVWANRVFNPEEDFPSF